MSKASRKKTKKKPIKAKKQAAVKDWMLGLAVAVFGFILYANTIQHGFVLDDPLVCVKNDYVQEGFGGLGKIFTGTWYEGFNGEQGRYYRPMMLAGFAIEKQLFGHQASTYHLMNVLTYAFLLFVLFYVLRRMFKDQPFWLPLSITLLFAAHPIHTEVVANIKSRDELYAMLGLLGMLYGLLRYGEEGQNKHLALSLAGYAFALLSKESSLAFLGLVPVTLYFFTKESWAKIGGLTVAFGALAGLYLLLRASIVSGEPNDFGIIDNALLALDSRGEQLASALGMVSDYMRLLLVPHPLSYDYSYSQISNVGWGSLRALLGLGLLLGMLGYAGWRSPKKDKLAYAIFWMAITFVVTSNILILIGATFAERFMFIPSLGFCMILGLLADRFLRKGKMPPPQLYLGVLGGILLLYSFKTVTRNAAWESDPVLFATDLYTAPNSSRVQNHYATSIYNRALTKPKNDPQRRELLLESVEHFQKSVEIHPGFTACYQNMGLAYVELGDTSKALQAYRTGIQQEPEYYPIWTNVGVVYYQAEQYRKALTYFEKATTLGPNNSANHNGVGSCYHKLNNYDKAIEAYKRAHELSPADQGILQSLVGVYRQKGDIETAIFYDKKIKALRAR
ncbi:MAG: tetratricopeptide repeat protein [Bacteroidota bacterium]